MERNTLNVDTSALISKVILKILKILKIMKTHFLAMFRRTSVLSACIGQKILEFKHMVQFGKRLVEL